MSVESLVAALMLKKGDPMAWFTAYFDGSGTAHDQPVLAVAGFMGAWNGWLSFEQAWLARLKQNRLKLFHSTDSRRRRKNGGRREAREDALVADLIEIIRVSGARKFGCCVYNEGIERIPRERRKAWHIHAYSWAGFWAVRMMMGWRRDNKFDADKFPRLVFEDGDDGRHHLEHFLIDEGYPKPIFEPKKDRVTKLGIREPAAVPLQAADLLAFQIFDSVRAKINHGRLQYTSKAYRALSLIPGPVRCILPKQADVLYQHMKVPRDEIVITDWLPS